MSDVELARTAHLRRLVYTSYCTHPAVRLTHGFVIFRSVNEIDKQYGAHYDSGLDALVDIHHLSYFKRIVKVRARLLPKGAVLVIDLDELSLVPCVIDESVYVEHRCERAFSYFITRQPSAQ